MLRGFFKQNFLDRLWVLSHVPFGVLIFLALVNIPYLYYMWVIRGKFYLLTSFERSFFSAWIILLLVKLVPKKLIRACYVIIVSVAIIVFVLDTYSVYQYSHPFNAGMLDIIISSNPNEAYEYIIQFITCKVVLTIVVSLLCLVGLVWLLDKSTKLYIHKRMVAILFLMLLITNFVDCTRLGYETWSKFVSESFSVKRLIDIGIGTYANVLEYEKYEQSVPLEDIKVTENNSDIPYVVFVIGESTSRNHMSLYGYELNTNPLLQQRQERGELDVFTDVISHHSHTLTVMRELLTFYRRDSKDDWFKYVNLFDILKKTDYRTYWLSNQEYSGIYSLDKFYSRRCDYSYFTSMRDSKDESILIDGALLTSIQNLDFGKKNFITIHLMGTHTAYERRYPIEYALFSEKDEKKGADVKQKKVRAYYDNAVLYNDYVLNTIINMFAQRDAIVIYVSDHADEVYEDRDFVGHTESMGTTHMIEVPLLIWTSQSFRSKRPELTSRIESAVNRPFMTDDMIHVILDIMQIETEDYAPSKSVINDGFMVTKRTYNGKTYEKNGEYSMLIE